MAEEIVVDAECEKVLRAMKRDIVKGVINCANLHKGHLKARALAKKEGVSGEPPKRRAPSAYILFGNAERSKIRGLGPQETTSELGKRWRGLSDAQKKKWQDLARRGASPASSRKRTTRGSRMRSSE